MYYVCMYVRVYVCMYVRMYVCTYLCMYVCTYVCMYVCMYGIRTPMETITADKRNELYYRVDVCRITNVAHIEHL